MSYSCEPEKQCCLNCCYWCGERKVNISKRWESPHNYTKGECRVKARMNPGATEGTDCRKFVRMPSK